jgi:hypothetical protein
LKLDERLALLTDDANEDDLDRASKGLVRFSPAHNAVMGRWHETQGRPLTAAQWRGEYEKLPGGKPLTIGELKALGE